MPCWKLALGTVSAAVSAKSPARTTANVRRLWRFRALETEVPYEAFVPHHLEHVDGKVITH